MKHLNTYTKGYVLLVSVILLGALGVAVTGALLYASVSVAQSSGSIVDSAQANALANACAEVALQKLAASSAFIGSDNKVLGQGSCTYSVVASTTSWDTIKSTGTVNTAVRKVQLNIAIPQLVIFSWQEVADFN